MSVWDSLGNIQSLFSNSSVPGKKNNRLPFGAALDLSKSLPGNPGGWNDQVEAARSATLTAAQTVMAPVINATVGQADKATGGKLTKVLMAGANEVRSNYAFVRDTETKNAGMSLLAGLSMLGGGILGGLAGATLGPAGAYAGFTLGSALVGKIERSTAKAIGGGVGKSATFAESQAGQEQYNFGRDVVKAASHVKGFKSLGDTSKGIGAITSGLLNFGFEMGTGPDIGAGKLVGAAGRRTLVGGFTEGGSRIASKLLEEKFATQTADRIATDIDLLKRTGMGEKTIYTPLFDFISKNNAATIINRAGFADEMGNSAAQLLAGQTPDRIALVLRAGRGDAEALTELSTAHADLFAQMKRYDSELKTVEKNGYVATLYQDRNIMLGPDTALKQNVDLIKSEVESLSGQVKWLDDALKLDSTLQNRTVSRWAWVEKVRNDAAKERLNRKLELGGKPELDTSVGRLIQTFYSSGTFGGLVRMIDRAVDDSPKGVINFNDPIQMPDRFRANIRSAIRHAGLQPEIGLDYYNRLINAGREIDKYSIIKEYTDYIANTLGQKHGVSEFATGVILKAYDDAHKTLLEKARSASLTEKGYMIDELSGEIYHDPVLVTQLANGAYMPDVKAWDKAYERYSKKYGAAASKIETTAATANFLLEEFNGLWRGFTLLRGGYPMNIIRDSAVRAYGDGVLFDMAKELSKDAIEGMTKFTANVKTWQDTVQGALSPRKSAQKLRVAINDREVAIKHLRKKLDEAGYDFANPPKKVTATVQGTLDIHNELLNTVKELRRQETEIITNKPRITVGRDKSQQIYGYDVPAANSGRFADISRQQLSQKEDLRRALESAKELEVENVRRTRTGTKTLLATDNEADHLLAWEEALKDVIGFDAVARKIMSGETKKNIVKWMSSPEGNSYLDRLGFMPSDARDAYARAESLVNQYAPKQELRDMVLQDRVNVDELRKLYPNVEERPPVLSDMVRDMAGKSNAYVKMRNMVKDGVAWLSTQPTSKLMFSPYFAVKYNTKFQSLIYNASIQGRVLTQKELEHFELVSRQFAIREYKQKLNSFHKDMNYNGAVNYLLAFFPAVVEQYRAYGRITAENPDFIIKATQISLLPQRLGQEQEGPFGNKFVEVSLPMLGGLKARLNTQWFNVWNPTGSSIISASPYLSAGINEYTKRHDIDNWVTRWALPFGSSADSLTSLSPNTLRRATQLFKAQLLRNGDQFNRDSAMFLNQLRVEFTQENGHQPNSSELSQLGKEAESKSISLAWLRFISSATMPTQPQWTTGLQAYADELNKLRQSGIPNPDEVFIEKYPDYFLLTSRLADSTSGINSDATSTELVKKNPDFVRELVVHLGKDNYNVLGAVFNDSNYAFSSGAQAYLESTKIPGTNTKFRDVSGYLEAARQSTVAKGWKDLTQVKDIVNDELIKANINPSSKYGMAVMKQYKDAYIASQKEKNPMWYNEYEQGYAGSNRQQKTIDALTMAANNPQLWEDLRKQPQWTNIVNYLNFRYDVYDELKRRKTTITSDRAIDIASKVNAYVNELRKDTNFARFYDRYFDNDKFDYVYGG